MLELDTTQTTEQLQLTNVYLAAFCVVRGLGHPEIIQDTDTPNKLHRFVFSKAADDSAVSAALADWHSNKPVSVNIAEYAREVRNLYARIKK